MVEGLITVFMPSIENFFNSRTLRAIRCVYWDLKAKEVISSDYSHSPENRTILPLHASISTSEATSLRKTSLSHPLELSLKVPCLCHLPAVLQCISLAGCHRMHLITMLSSYHVRTRYFLGSGVTKVQHSSTSSGKEPRLENRFCTAAEYAC